MHRAASATAALEARRRLSANASATLFFSCTTFSNLSAISLIARVLVSKPLSNAAARAFVSRSETASASNASRRARSAETGDSAETSSPAWSSRAAPNEFDARSVVGGVHGWSSELSPPEEPRELPGEADPSRRRAAEYEASLSSLASSSSIARCFLGVMSSPGARSETRAAGWPPSSSGSPRTSPGAVSGGDARDLACGSSRVSTSASSPAWTSTPSANPRPR